MSLATGDLTTLAEVRGYIANAPADSVLTGLISRMSRAVMGYLNRSSLNPRTYSQLFMGSGTGGLVLPEYPVLSVSSVNIDGAVVPASTINLDSVYSSGYRFETWDGRPPGDPAVLQLLGYWGFSGPVTISYVAGYRVSAETLTVPATPFQYTPLCPYGIWSSDQGVTYANGTALVPTTGTPTAGHYVPPTPDAATPIAFYQFAAADAGQALAISYGYVPGDVEQTVIELIAERVSYRNRIGVRSQSLAGQESIAFDTSGFPPYAVKMLKPYVSVLPPAMGVNV